MTNPKVELRGYLRKLMHRFRFITQMDDELSIILTWLGRPDGINAIEEGASFFNLVQRSFNQNLLIELCKFIDDDEEKSLRDYLSKAKECAEPLEPVRFNIDEMRREVVSRNEFENIINEHIRDLENHNRVISNLKARRDKALAHTDASFFNNPKRHYETYPLMVEDISHLLETLKKILKEHWGYLFESDLDMQLYTTMGVDRVLEFIRAYCRILEEDSEALKYRWDDFVKS